MLWLFGSILFLVLMVLSGKYKSLNDNLLIIFLGFILSAVVSLSLITAGFSTYPLLLQSRRKTFEIIEDSCKSIQLKNKYIFSYNAELLSAQLRRRDPVKILLLEGAFISSKVDSLKPILKITGGK